MSSSSVAATGAVTYTIDPAHSNAHFKVRHMMISNVRGEFSKVSGTVTFNAADLAACGITAEIDVNSISTREPDRDNHLKSADFFDAANHPTIRFQSKKVEQVGKDEYKVGGGLTIRGVTRDVTLDVHAVTPEVKDPWGFLRRGAEAQTKVNRKDYGLVWNSALETGGVMVGDEIEITLDVELTRKA